jgi:nucleotide-binding universal stress UspA family protein
MGTHGRSGFDTLLLGSVTDKILRKATCPVLTIPPTASVISRDGRYKTILCAVDFSPASVRGLDYALSLAQETDAAITLAHVIEWPWTTGRPLTATEAGYRQAAHDKALLDLRQAIPPDVYDWCRPDVELGEGRAHEEIVRMARDRQADLIVVGVHGRSALGMAVFGSTANQVIRHAACPVLTVRF